MNVKESKRKAQRGNSAIVKRHRSRDMFGPELKELKDKNLLRKHACISSSNGPEIIIDGRTYIDFSSNDYLNLSVHSRIIKAVSNALKKNKFGSGASRLLSGTYDSHVRLEERIAGFKKTCVSLSANAGMIPVFAA